MCGIFGVVARQLPESCLIKDALDAIRHRGPDDEVYLLAHIVHLQELVLAGRDTHRDLKANFIDMADADTGGFQLALAHRRLSILDVSSQGHQPFGNADGTLWITYNGEIFNYRELRKELKAKGYRFRSDTDTEVVLSAYQEWGDSFVHRLNGQWAFCIYDRPRKRLFCSRDRFGVKPFYYWHDGERFVFASEIKAFFKLPFVPREINRSALSDFVLFQRLEHTQESVYAGIYQLLAGHNLVFDLAAADLHIIKYYDLTFNDQTGRYSHKKALRYADDIRDLFIDSVRIRLVSDVPVGSCLSGGLDSSFIVAVISRLLKDGAVDQKAIVQKQKTFTSSFDDPAVDEKPYVKKIIRHTSVDGYYDYPQPENLWKDIDRFLFFQDGLCFGTNVWAGWEVMRLASRHVKVVINGQGSDEIFGGYPRYDALHLAVLARRGHLKHALDFLVKKSRVHGIAQGFAGVLKDGIFASLPVKIRNCYLERKLKERADFIDRLIGADRSVPNFSLFYPGSRTSLNNQLWSDQTRDYLPMLLRYDDRNAAAFSIENRVPFLDHRLVEYVNNIPSIYKIYSGWNKWLLRLAMRGMLPDEIVWRKDKNGFSTPQRKWLSHVDSAIRPLRKRYGVKRFSNRTWCYLLADKLLRAGEPSEVTNDAGGLHV